jgi:hypothetical protein
MHHEFCKIAPIKMKRWAARKRTGVQWLIEHTNCVCELEPYKPMSDLAWELHLIHEAQQHPIFPWSQATGHNPYNPYY